MLLIFCSSFTNKHEGLDQFTKRLDAEGVKYIVLNPLILSLSNVTLSHEGEKIYLRVDNETFSPTTFFLLNNWRADSTIEIPSNVKYPSVFRLRVHQFLQDIRFAFEKSVWIPGKIESIERADSKPRLMLEAFKSGLTVPLYTINTSGGAEFPKKEKVAIRKSIGPPFSVSLNTDTGEEVGITTTNTITEEFDPDGQLWQWQEPIETVSQVRCFICRGRVWSVLWQKRDLYADLRFVSQVSGEKVDWQPYTIPSAIERKLFKLLDCLLIEYASPEFLLTARGELIFIDMNPCGDWIGFFSQSTNSEIVETLVHLVKEVMQKHEQK